MINRPAGPADPARTAARVRALPGRLWAATTRPSWRRPVWWIQVAIIYAFVVLYDVLRNVAPTRSGTSFRHAAEVLHLEGVLNIDVEQALNGWFAAHTLAAVPANWFYDSAHYVVTFSVLVFVYLRREAAYRGLRNALLLTNVVGLLGFWLYPLAPPRMMPGYVDTVALHHTPFADTITSSANQFAAMPSLHVGWAVWVAAAVLTVTRRVVLRLLALAYPLVTTVVVLGTGNHYLLDVVAGVACAAVGILVPEGVGRLHRSWQLRRDVTTLVAATVPAGRAVTGAPALEVLPAVDLAATGADPDQPGRNTRRHPCG